MGKGKYRYIFFPQIGLFLEKAHVQTLRHYLTTTYFSLSGGDLRGSLVQTPGTSTRSGQPWHGCSPLECLSSTAAHALARGCSQTPSQPPHGQIQQAQLGVSRCCLWVFNDVWVETGQNSSHLDGFVGEMFPPGCCNHIQPQWMQSSSWCFWLFCILMQRFLRNKSQETYLFVLLSLPSHQPVLSSS